MILESAKELSRGNTEVDWRNAVSRAYYAAYHRCRPIAARIDSNVDATTAGGHAAIIGLLQKRPASRTQLAAGYLLRQCRTLRNRADYEVDDDFTRVSCQNAIDQCVQIFEKADAIN